MLDKSFQSDVIFKSIDSYFSFAEQLAADNLLLDILPVSIYWKDTKGRYLGRNQYAVEQSVFQGYERALDKRSIIGKTDFDLFPEKTAKVFHENDTTIINECDKPQYFIEEICL